MTRMSGWVPAGGVPRVRRGPGRRAGAAQRRHQVTDIEPAPAPKVTEYVAQAKAVPVLRDGHRGGAAAARAGAGQLRAGDLRAGREPDLRAPHPRLAGRRCCWPAGRHRGLDGVDGRDPRARPPRWSRPAGSRTGSGSC